MSIQKMRLKRGWSQQQLADACGLSARTIQRIESGHAASIESLKSIAAVFEVHFQTLTETAMNDESTNKINETINPQTAQERIAFKRTQRLRGYYLHLMMYLVTNAGCLIINLLTTPDKLWFFGTLIFWGIGLVVHTLTIFVFDKYFTGEWELAKVEKYLGRSL